MSIDSALIVRRNDLPTIAELTAAIAETGVTAVFQDGFALDRNPDGWVSIRIDGEQSGFDYGVDALHDLEAEAAPEALLAYGDTMLTFGARGALSAEAVGLIQRTLAGRWNVAGWIDDELISAEDLAREDVADAGIEGSGIDPVVAAMMRGSLAERAAARDAYFSTAGPLNLPSMRKENPVIEWLRGHVFEFVVFAATVVVIILWKTLI